PGPTANLGQWRRRERQVALDAEPEGVADRRQLAQGEVAQLVLEAFDEAEEPDVARPVLVGFGLALGHEPRPAGAGQKAFQVDNGILGPLLSIERGKGAENVLGDQLHVTPPSRTRPPASARRAGRSDSAPG